MMSNHLKLGQRFWLVMSTLKTFSGSYYMNVLALPFHIYPQKHVILPKFQSSVLPLSSVASTLLYTDCFQPWTISWPFGMIKVSKCVARMIQISPSITGWLSLREKRASGFVCMGVLAGVGGGRQGEHKHLSAIWTEGADLRIWVHSFFEECAFTELIYKQGIGCIEFERISPFALREFPVCGETRADGS